MSCLIIQQHLDIVNSSYNKIYYFFEFMTSSGKYHVFNVQSFFSFLLSASLGIFQMQNVSSIESSPWNTTLLSSFFVCGIISNAVLFPFKIYSIGKSQCFGPEQKRINKYLAVSYIMKLMCPPTSNYIINDNI